MMEEEEEGSSFSHHSRQQGRLVGNAMRRSLDVVQTVALRVVTYYGGSKLDEDRGWARSG